MMSPSVTDQLSHIQQAIARSRDAIARGAEIEYLGLDSAVARVVQDAQQAGSAERRGILSVLEALLHEIDELETDLQQRHAGAVAERASRAYTPQRDAR
jgi:hypothetical protein